MPEANILKPELRTMILNIILMFPNMTFMSLILLKNRLNSFLMHKLSIMAFALPEVNIVRHEVRPMILNKILIFPKMTFIHLR